MVGPWVQGASWEGAKHLQALVQRRPGLRPATGAAGEAADASAVLVRLQVMAVGTVASWSSRQRRWRHTGCSVGRTGNGFRA